MVVKAGFSRGVLKYLSDAGRLEHASRGVYILPEVWEDEFVNIQSRYKRGIYALDTALFLCDLTDRTPAKFHMVFPSTYNLSNPKRDGIVCSGRKIKEQGYEQAELTVVEGNDRAYHLYESLGFKECGRVPNANKYDDGTYSDDILMVLSLRDEGRNENLA